MGITFVGAGAEGSALASAGTTISPGLPSGLANDDILICVFASRAGGIDPTIGSGEWTQIVNAVNSNRRLTVWWHRYNSGSPPGTTITHSSTTVKVAGIAAFRGVRNVGDPYDQVGTVATNSSSTIEFDAITTTAGKNGCMILAISGTGANSGQDQSRTLTSGWSNVFEDTESGTQNCYRIIDSTANAEASVSIFYQLQSVAGSADLSVTKAATNVWNSVLVALTPDEIVEVGVNQSISFTPGLSAHSILHPALNQNLGLSPGSGLPAILNTGAAADISLAPADAPPYIALSPSSQILSFVGGQAPVAMQSIYAAGSILFAAPMIGVFRTRTRRRVLRWPVHHKFTETWPNDKGRLEE
jgi:hypothetical protein